MSTVRRATVNNGHLDAHGDGDQDEIDKNRRKSMNQTHALMTWVRGQNQSNSSPDVNSTRRRKGFPRIGKSRGSRSKRRRPSDILADTLPVGILGANIQTEFMNFRLAKSDTSIPHMPHFWSPSGKQDSSIGGWMSAFEREKHMFTSADIFSKIKFSEALEIVSCAARPTHLLSVTIVQILREIEAQLGNSRNLVALALVDCLLSTFVNYGQKLTSALAYDIFQHPLSAQSVRGMQVLPAAFETGLTYFEHIDFLEKQQQKEISMLPQFKANLRRQKHLTYLQIRIINQTVENWTKSFAQVAFNNFVWCWRQRKKLRRFIRFAFKLKTLGKRQCMEMWKAYVKTRRLAKQNLVQLDVAKRLTSKSKTLAETRRYNDSLSLALKETNEKLKSFEAQVAEKEALLQLPERQPVALGAVTVTLAQALQSSSAHLERMLTEQANDVDEFAALEPACSNCLNSFTTHLGDQNQSATNKLLSFVPAKNVYVKESHPAYEPLKHHAGLVLRDWLTVQVPDFFIARPAPLKTSHLEDGNLYAQLLRKLLDVKQQRDERAVPTLGAMVNMLPQERVEDAIVMARSDIRNPTANFMRPADVTGVESALNADELQKQEALNRKLEAISAGRNVVCHVVTAYFGKRLLSPAEVSERKQFAWLAHLFVTHFHHESKGWLLETGLSVREQLEKVQKQIKDLHEATSKFSLKTLPNTFPTEFLSALSGGVNNTHTAYKKELAEFVSTVIEPAKLQREWMEFHHELLLLAWQSMSTQILARRSVSEVDVDDGTFTKLHPKALKDIFSKLRLTKDALNGCISSMTDTLKAQIRLTKRTYQYYAACGTAGKLDTMDRYEFWKFIKESKVQANRKMLPSGDVDLIYDKIMKSRIVNTETNIKHREICPQAFIHGLVRLAFKRHNKEEVNDRLKMLFDKEIDGRTSVASVDVFRDRMKNDDVKHILDHFHEVLKQMFDQYACADQTGEAVLALDTMNKKEIIEWGTDFNLLGATLSQRNLHTVFAYCQQSDDMDVLDSDDTEMVYSEFLEAVLAVSCWIIPDPYLTMGMRVRRFIQKYLIPKFKTNIKL